MPNKLEMLITVSIESEDPHSSETLRMYLGGMRMRADDANGLGCRTDGSRSQADGPGGLTDAPSTSNKAETDVISHGDGMNTYLGAGDTKRAIDATDGVETHADASTRQGEVPSVESDVSSVETNMRMAVNVRRDVRKCQAEAQTQNSPKGPQIEPPKSTRRWKRVGVGDISVYLPWNAPIEALGRTLVFREVKSGEKAIAPSVEGKTARDDDGNGDPNRGDGDSGDGDGTASGNSIDLSRVKAVRLAEESQHMRWSRRKRTKYSPVLSGPPTKPADRPYGAIRPRRRRGRLKVEPAKVSQALKVEMTYLERARATQPPGYPSKRLHRVIGPRRQCG